MAGPILLTLRIVMVLILYLFLAWVFLTLWADLRAKGRSLADRRVPPLRLRAEAEAASKGILYNQAQITVGRNPTCDCVIEDDTVSSYHARITYRNNQWWVEDLNSTNGTFINGQRVSIPIVLTTKDRLKFGQIVFSVEVEPPP